MPTPATFFAGAVGSATLTARVGGAEGLAADITIFVSNNGVVDLEMETGLSTSTA